MNINELPDEILVRILSFLPPSDRLESALTCRRWAQTVAQAPPLLRDIWLVIGDCLIEEAEPVFADTHRQYENLRIGPESRGNFSAAFWTSIGAGLRKLELSIQGVSPEKFYSILEACSNLESLKITHRFCNILTTHKLSELPPGMNLEGIQKSMRNLHHLHLDFCVDADTLEHLFILMPNVSSIALSSFDRKSNFLNRLSNMLGTSRKITVLNLDYKEIGRDGCEQLWRMSSASLQTLVYHGPAPIVLDKLRNCSMLRDLDLSWDRPLDDFDIRLLQNILRNVPELESLVIRGESWTTKFRREDLMPIVDLRKLRQLKLYVRLDLERDYTHVPDGIVALLSKMIALESLAIGDEIGIVDSVNFRILASMPNLRDLEIHNLRWDAECLRIVLFEPRKLRTLNIVGLRNGTPVSHYRESELDRNIPIPQQEEETFQQQGEEKFSSLEALRIKDIPLSDGSLGRITAQHSRLKIVWILGTTDITDAGLVTLFQHEPLLEELYARDMHKVKGTFFEGLGELCRRLHSLDVDYATDWCPARREFTLRRPRVKC